MRKILSLSLLVLALSLSGSTECHAKAQKAQAKAKTPVKTAAVTKAAPRAQAKAPARALAARPAAKVQGRSPSNYLPSGSGGGMATVGGVHESDKPIQVTGQSRNLSMMLVLKNEKDKIDFVEVRRSFRKEVGNTQY